MKIENIKFKAKKIEVFMKGEWIEGELRHACVKYPEKVHIAQRIKNGCVIIEEVDPSTVCQFTGLTDYKGNEIFEHDLIHFVGYEPIGEVIWSEDDYAFMVASRNEPLYWLSDVINIGKIERVGNKFDKK